MQVTVWGHFCKFEWCVGMLFGVLEVLGTVRAHFGEIDGCVLFGSLSPGGAGGGAGAQTFAVFR